ncbi:hypothetical protein FNF29_05946 [Cafeteria roenbergensis]|uniref:Cytoplasmic dynein 2 heavy chain 1 n=1 Tax=Cafeteria roenbergensis TaxID=33653 RepID=A0A5A8C8K6_CAFRO|nr:hypothetical protein FNF29_05946 [Cafeteria roenbergensis]|eukprot:KAA0149393.1 hypothetical protein FNF29_05946 [Cafeteria roenbergensis]
MDADTVQFVSSAVASACGTGGAGKAGAGELAADLLAALDSGFFSGSSASVCVGYSASGQLTACEPRLASQRLVGSVVCFFKPHLRGPVPRGAAREHVSVLTAPARADSSAFAAVVAATAAAGLGSVVVPGLSGDETLPGDGAARSGARLMSVDSAMAELSTAAARSSAASGGGAHAESPQFVLSLASEALAWGEDGDAAPAFAAEGNAAAARAAIADLAAAWRAAEAAAGAVHATHPSSAQLEAAGATCGRLSEAAQAAVDDAWRSGCYTEDRMRSLLGCADDALAAASAMAAVETQAAGAIADRISAAAAAGGSSRSHLAALATLAEFRHALGRPGVAKALATERAAALAQLSSAVESADAELEARTSRSLEAATGSPSIAATDAAVAGVAFAQGTRSRVLHLRAGAEPVLSGLPGWEDASRKCVAVAERALELQAALARAWGDAAQSALSRASLAPADGSLMTFDERGNMRVTFREDLVAVGRQARQLGAMGFPPPAPLARRVGRAEQALRFSASLRKIAAFYNSMGAQMLPCTKPLLLEQLAAFEEAVHGGSVSWEDQTQCAAYVARLQASGDKVVRAIGTIKAAHDQLGHDAASVAELDVLRQQQLLKRLVRGLRALVEPVVRSQPVERAAPWLRHWDRQLYKALEASWRTALESLSESLPPIRCELSLAGKRVAFKPPLEELRATYYREVKKAVGLPGAVRPLLESGASEDAQLFKAMMEYNSAALAAVYRKAEILFARLGRLRDSFAPWAAVGRLEGGDAALEALVSALAVGPGHWGAALQALKGHRKELDRIQDMQTVDCVAVSLAPLKAAAEDHLQRLADTLLLALRRSLVELVSKVEHFVAAGGARLGAKVESMSDIAAAQTAFAELREQQGAMASLVSQSEALKRQLVQLSHQAGGVAAEAALAPTAVTLPGGEVAQVSILERVSSLPDAWAGFERALGAFDDRVRDERERLRETVRTSAEGMGKQAASFLSRWRGVRPPTDADADWSDEGVEKALALVAQWEEGLAGLEKEASDLKASCEAFGMEPPQWGHFDEAKEEVGVAVKSWSVMREYRAARDGFAKEDWLGFRSRIFELQDFAAEWMAKCRGDAAHDGIKARIALECDLLRKASTGFKYARGEPFRDEHWTVALMKLGLPRGVRADSLTVGQMLAEPVLKALAEQAAFLKDLNARAQGEVTIREALQELRAWTETCEFQLHEHTSLATGKVTPVIREWADTFTEIGDNQSLLHSLKESSYFKPFADQAAPLEARLGLLDDCCQDLNGVQRRWVYLEPIFGRGALPAEQPRFKRVDEDFRSIMASVSGDPRVFQLTDTGVFPGLRDRLKGMVAQLDRCQKALADFLELKRSAFPRFYFLGDDDLLEILGQAKDPNVVRAHMPKLFQGIHSVGFAEGGASGRIDSISSASGEAIVLTDGTGVPRPVATDGEEVEDWLTELVDGMRRTLACSLAAAVRERGDGPSDLSKFPSQVLGVAEEVAFSSRVEAAFSSGSLDRLQGAVASQLRDLTALAAAKPASAAGGADSGGVAPLTRLKVKALVLDTIHRADVLDQLRREKADSADSWAWQRQLRFYATSAGSSAPRWARDGPGTLAEARMVSARIPYSYEYQGTPGKLVHTPLTDKCYLALTQGIAMGYGGNPYGPAGTGKTESVKALGGALGRQVLVFNCDEGIDFRSMGRIFTGLVRCGAWGCFDEFNRLKPDQLSAVSQQIQVIQAAIKSGAPSLELLGREISVDVNAGIFVTMNPAGKGYGGRSKLPDNLKQLFRPVAMSKPDNELIAEVLLFAEGFRGARALGRKIASLFGLSRQLLTQQQHYDWGLRAMKTCLNTSGSLLAAARTAGGIEDDSAAEASALIQAIRVNTLSKLTAADARRFAGLMRDVFPGRSMADARSEALEAAMLWAMTGSGGAPSDSQKLVSDGGVALGKLKHEPGQVAKMLQLKESLDQRMGCVIVGPSGCGKSTLWRVLRAALQQAGQRVKVHVMNPKAMPRSRLLGEMDPDTREWKDGVLTAAARQVVREPADVRSWIVCDGDVDPEWIESLNSVLDDNHLLTLPNGERISFGPNVNFLFETHDLRHASPATISRMGMIFLSDDDVDPRRIVDAWLSEQAGPKASSSEGGKAGGGAAPSSSAALEGWVASVFLPALDWVRSRLDPAELATPTTLVATVRSGLSHVCGTTSAAGFAMGTVRGLGSNVPESKRAEFASAVFRMAGVAPPDPANPLCCQADDDSGLLVPLSSGSIGFGGSGGDVDELDEIVPLDSMLRNLAVLAPWFQAGDPVVVVGPPGCGKSLLVKQATGLSRGAKLVTLHCSAQTSPEHVVQKLKQSCGLFSSTTGRVFRPKEGDRMVLFLRGIDLPKPDKWGTCPLVAFLQQLLAFGGFYDETLEFLRVERVQIVASVSPQNALGRHSLSGRFTAAVRTLFVADPSADELRAVAGRCLRRSLAATSARGHDPAFAGAALAAGADRLASSMVRVWSEVRERFQASEHRHYVFSPRDVVQWAAGLESYSTADGGVLGAVAYEGRRLFRDKLVSADERMSFDGVLSSGLREEWGALPSSTRLYSAAAPVLLGLAVPDSDQQGTVPGSRMWPQLHSIARADFETAAKRGLTLFRREERLLQFHLFDQAVNQLAVVDRCLGRPGGHLLLVGAPGVGRRSAVSLVAHMLRMRVFEPSLSRGFGAKQFAGELKQAMAAAAIEDGGSPVVLFLPEGALEDDHVLEMANSLAASGEVPGLYGQDEADSLLSPLRESIADAKAGSAEAACKTPWELFVLRVRQRLHVAVALDPSSPLFARRCESNPALLTACTVAWFGGWEREALEVLPGMALGRLTAKPGDGPQGAEADQEDGAGDEEELDDADAEAAGDAASLGALMADVHQWCAERPAAEGVVASPRDFSAMMKGFKAVLLTQRANVRSEAQRLESGLGKLHEAERTVAELQAEAASQKADLKVKQSAADSAMQQITEALAKASDRRREVEVLTKHAEEAGAATAERKAEVESELGGITPVLEAAREAVGGIDSRTLTYLRNLKAPPQPIVDVLSGVLRMLGNEDLSWTSMRRFLGSSGAKMSVINFDPSSISNATRTAVAQVVRKHAQSFEEATIRRALGDAAPLAAWVKACLKFSIVMEKIEPLQAELRKASAALSKAQRELDENQAELDGIDRLVAELKAAFQKRTAEAETLRLQLQRTEDTLARAQTLLEKLGGEKGRWEATVKGAQAKLAALPAQALVAAAFMAYLPGTPEDVRKDATAAWLSLAASSSASAAAGSRGGPPHASDIPALHRLLASESEALEWRSRGLPDDGLSTENAAIILHAEAMTGRAPLIVDPAGAATEWLVKQLSAAPHGPAAGRGAAKGGAPARSSAGGRPVSVEVVAEGSPKLQTSVELAARFGKTLVITEASGISPVLFALLGKDLRVQGARNAVMVGDKLVDYGDSFRAFVCTRDPAVQLEPSARALVTTVNFTVTRSGLEGQLLGATLREILPTLETEKSRLLREEEDLKMQLADLERGLIQELAASEGDLLENKSLVSSLTLTKSKSADIATALEASAATAVTIDEQRDSFRPLAQGGSRLFFLLGSLAAHNHMYQFSLADFLTVFVGTVRDGAASMSSGEPFGAEQAVRLVPELQRRILLFVSRSLLKEDRLMFGLHLAHGCLPDLFRAGEWELFTGQATVAAGGAAGRPPSLPLWAPPDRATAFAELATAVAEPMRRSGLLRTPLPPEWDAWGTRAGATIDDMPPDALASLSAWQRLLVVRALRPDRLVSAMSDFVCSTLGVESVSPAPSTLAELAAEAGPRKPLLMVTTVGADPTRDLEEAAAAAVEAGARGGEGPSGYRELAMGGGQQDEAIRMLRDAAADGGWICLKNLHLVTSWLPALQQELAALSERHPSFRLWLTTECNDDFPPFLLQECLKVTFEAPPGLRRNLERTVSAWPSDFVARGPPVRRHLLALLAAFHGLVQERRTYVPQGWTKAYEFSAGDLRAAASVIDTVVESAAGGALPWRTLHGVLEGAIYGGRVDDPADVRVLRAFVRICFHPDLLPKGPEELGRAAVGGVRVPFACSTKELADFARALPVTDSPKLFRLPANAERSLQRATSDRVVSSIVSLSAASASVSGFEVSLWRAALGPVLEAWDMLRSSLPSESELTVGSRGGAGAAGAGDEEPVAAFVAMEASRGAALFRLVSGDLEALRRVLSGREALTSAVERLGEALMSSAVPSAWAAQWEGPQEPRAWMREAVSRVKAVFEWRRKVARGGLLSAPVKLAELFRPETFLNAVRQQTARALGVAIDELELETSFSGRRELVSAGVPADVIVEADSLLMQGATLGGSPAALQEAKPDAPDLAATPPCSMAWVSPDAKRALADADASPRLRVPLYSSPARERIVAEVSLPVGSARGGAARWVMAGVGVFVSGSS